jgi:hypothetical protein
MAFDIVLEQLQSQEMRKRGFAMKTPMYVISAFLRR